MKSLFLAGTILAAIGIMPTRAVTATFCGPDSEGGTCEGPSELKVFLDMGKNVTSGIGDVGSPGSSTALDFSSDSGLLNIQLDVSGGFATIKPAQGFSTFNGIDITIPGFTFTDLAFDVQLTPVSGQTTENFTISDFSGAHVSDGVGMESDAPDTDKQFSTTAIGGAFDEVNINSLTGFDEIKHIEVSGLAAIPEPSTWAMMVLGFAGLGWIAMRRRAQRFAF